MDILLKSSSGSSFNYTFNSFEQIYYLSLDKLKFDFSIFSIELQENSTTFLNYYIPMVRNLQEAQATMAGDKSRDTK